MQLQCKLNYNLHFYTMMGFKWNASHNWNIEIRLIIFCLLLHLCCFDIWFTCFDLIHYTINNTFSDIVISKLAKFITSHVHVLLLNYIFKHNHHFIFEKPIPWSLYVQLWFWWIQTLSTNPYITQKTNKNNES